MEISKLSFTKKTQEAMDRDMSVREKGKVLFARLKELDNDGTLSKAKSRADVARLVGYSEERAKAGYSWVSNLIHRNNLSETILNFTPSGKMEAEYHVVSSPDYDYQETKRRKDTREKRAQKTNQELRRWQDKVAAGYIPQAPEPQVFDEKQVASESVKLMPMREIEPPIIERATINKPIKIEITRGDMTIKVEMGDHEEASKLITTIMKGE